jgi:hypothetical protein
MTIEHKKRLADGGSNKLFNLGLSHAVCNEWQGRVLEDKRRAK